MPNANYNMLSLISNSTFNVSKLKKVIINIHSFPCCEVKNYFKYNSLKATYIYYVVFLFSLFYIIYPYV